VIVQIKNVHLPTEYFSSIKIFTYDTPGSFSKCYFASFCVHNFILWANGIGPEDNYEIEEKVEPQEEDLNHNKPLSGKVKRDRISSM
jgi:hypothetical protein